jgi:imidazolonepropionase-like amidohydrolase
LTVELAEALAAAVAVAAALVGLEQARGQILLEDRERE